MIKYTIVSILTLTLGLCINNTTNNIAQGESVHIINTANQQVAVLAYDKANLVEQIYILQGAFSSKTGEFNNVQINYQKQNLLIKSNSINLELSVTKEGKTENEVRGYGLVELNFKEKTPLDELILLITKEKDIYEAIDSAVYEDVMSSEGNNVENPKISSCASGGEGATSCSFSGKVGVATSSISISCSVSCRQGYYACCGRVDVSTGKPKTNVCGCVPEKL